MQPMMASASVSFWIFVAIACGVQVIGAVDPNPQCNITKVCLPKYQRVVPQCNQKGPGYDCLDKMFKDVTCKNDSLLIMVERDGYDLAERVVCMKNEIRNEYKTKPECWYGAVQCSRHLAFKPMDVNPQFCDEKKLAVSGCKRDIGLPAECTKLHSNFLDAILKSTLCRGSMVTVPVITVFFVTIMAMLLEKTLTIF